MRRVLASLLVLFATAAFAGSGLSSTQQHQARANHWIESDNGYERAGCSATAISAHALLTAGHCELAGATVAVDDALPIAPEEILHDKHDGMILISHVWDFKDVEPLSEFNWAPKQGEALYMFGNPQGVRSMFRVGALAGTTTIPNDDLVHDGSPIFVGTMNVQPGDSGSSIYTHDGRRVGVLTYGIFDGKFCGFYSLTFTPQQIAEAEK